MNELLKCPCCGNAAEVKHNLHYGGEYWVECLECGLRTKYFRTDGIGESEKLATKAWNKRKGKE